MASLPTPTIRIQEDLAPVKSVNTALRSSGPESSYAGGIYHTRSISRASFDRRSHVTDVEDGDDWQHGLGRTKQVFRGKTLFWYAVVSYNILELKSAAASRTQDLTTPAGSHINPLA
jgi:KUP system potassium uptake protein